MVDCSLCSVPFVSGETRIYGISYRINVFQPTQGAVYLGEVQRLMAYIIITIETVSFPSVGNQV